MANCSKQIHIWTQLYIYVFKHTDHDSWKNGYCFTWGMKKGAESEETMLPISSFSQCWELMHPEPPRPRWHFTSRCWFNILWHKVLSSAALMAHIHAIPTTLFHDELSLSLSLSLSLWHKEKQDSVAFYVWLGILLLCHKNLESYFKTHTQRSTGLNRSV